MMPFSSIDALYSQYKRDTEIVAQWLDAMSKAHGFLGATSRQPQASPKEQHTICVADFKPMADFLSRKKNVSVPSYLWTSLSRTIHFRSTYGSYLQQHRHTSTLQDQTGDKKHLYFIDVLKDVQDILKRISKPAAPVAPKTQTAPKASRFACLSVPQPATVEDAEDDKEDVKDYTSTPVQTNTSPNPPENNIKFEPWLDDMEEALFQWRLFSIDLQRVRKQVRQLWELYRAGRLSLEAVSTAHNLAVFVVCKLEQDISPIFKGFGGFVNMANTHFTMRLRGLPGNLEEKFGSLGLLDALKDMMLATSVFSNMGGFEIAEEEMLITRDILEFGSRTWRKWGSWGSYNGVCGQFIPTDNRQNMTSFDKCLQDKALVAGVLFDIHILAAYLNPCVGMRLDELSRAIQDLVVWMPKDGQKYCPDKEMSSGPPDITLRAIFATQLLLDSAHALGTSIERPWRELLDKTRRSYKSIKSWRKFYSSAGAPPTKPNINPSYLNGLQAGANFWQGTDPITKFREVEEYLPGCPKRPRSACTYLRHHAPLCGWWIQNIGITHHGHAIDAANHIELSISCARLYFVFLREKIIPEGSWPDMDAFLTLHRGELWATPPKPGQYLQSLKLAQGSSIAPLASNARVHPREVFTNKTKRITSNVKVSHRIGEALVLREVEYLTEEDLERLIADTRLRWYNGKAVKPCYHHGWAKAGKNKGDKKPQTSETDNIFLRAAQAIDAETQEQSFDYMSLIRVCWVVLRELKKRGQQILEPLCDALGASPKWEMIEEKNASGIVEVIFFCLSDSAHTVFREELSMIAGILLDLTKGLGRIVHTSTGIDWAEALKCTCDDIPSDPAQQGNNS